MKVTTIDKTSLRALRPAIESALKDAGIEGVAFRLGSATYSPGSNATFKLEVSLVKQDGTVATKEVTDWNRYAPLDGLPKDGIGKTVTINGRQVTITGYKPRRHKYPYSGTINGRSFKFTRSQVQRAFGVTPTYF